MFSFFYIIYIVFYIIFLILVLLQKLNETFEGKKDWKDLDFYLDKDEDNPDNTDGRPLRHAIEKEQSTTRQHLLTESLREERPFMGQTLGIDDNHRQTHIESSDYNIPSDIRTTYNERCGSADAPSSNTEPLDCTSSDMNQLQNTKHEPLDYTLDTDIDAEYNRSCMVEKVLFNSEANVQRQGSDPFCSLLAPCTCKDDDDD